MYSNLLLQKSYCWSNLMLQENVLAHKACELILRLKLP